MMNALDHVEKTDEVLEARGAVDTKNKPHVAGDAAEPFVDLLVRGLLIRWSAPKGHRTPETIHAELDKRAKKEALSLFSR